jgi:hypothetical protein
MLITAVQVHMWQPLPPWQRPAAPQRLKQGRYKLESNVDGSAAAGVRGL